MNSDRGRNIASVAIFWLFLAFCAGALGLGWTLNHAPVTEEARLSFSDLHVSLGLSAAILLIAQFILGAARYIFGASRGMRGRRETTAFWLRQLVYVAFVATAAAGLLALAYRGEQIFFFDYALPLWEVGDFSQSQRLQTAHGFAAYGLGGLILAYVAFATFNRLKPAAPLEERASEVIAPPTIVSLIADGLAHSFKLFGAAAFWLELFLGVVSALLLGFGYAGQSVSPDRSGFGEAIYWATGAIALLAVSLLFGSHYTKTAQALRVRPDHYLSHERRMAFWFVGAGGLINIFGALASFVGVGLSVAMLIGKTVSQPPGIAITDPVKIIRALDVFILLVNFSLLLAHFIGFGVAAWLSISALRSRHQYLVLRETGK